MELRQLRYFVEIAECLHYGNAAKKLFVSQPALSQQIQNLENELGVELFERATRTHLRKAVLTEAGATFLTDAKRILQLSQKAIETARKIGLHKQIVNLGVYKALLRERIVEIMTLFTTHFKEVEIKIIEFDTYLAVQHGLEEETIDLGMTLLPLKIPNLVSKTLKRGNLSVILSSKHPLANEPVLTLSMLKDEKWIEINRTLHPVYDQIESFFKQMGASRQIVQEVSSLDLLISLVNLERGVAFVPTLFDLSHEPNIVAKKLDELLFNQIEINHVLAFRANNSDPLIRAFLLLLN